MRKLNEKFCIAPFGVISISPKGFIRPCCVMNYDRMYNEPNPNIKDNSDSIVWPTPIIQELREIMLGDNIVEKTPQCRYCWDAEAAGVKSYRQLSNPDYPLTLIDNPKIESLDIQFGSLCNLSCIMCGPTLSSHLYSTRKKLEKITTNTDLLQYYERTNMSDDNLDWTKDDASYSKLLKLAEDATIISITGGEPLMNPRFKHFLEYLLNKDVKINLLRITTNGTHYDDEIIDMVNKFSRVLFKISLEGLNEIDEFIRWPTNWSQKQENIKKFTQRFNSGTVQIMFSSVIQTLNIFYLKDVKDFVTSLEYSNKIFKFQIVQSTNINSVKNSSPEYISYYLENFLGKVDIPFTLTVPSDNKKDVIMQTAMYSDMAKMQNKNIKDIFPIYYEFHKDYLK
jgi:MoaA/NifB/PqqE/SkfB family radical SAM enzyme